MNINIASSSSSSSSASNNNNNNNNNNYNNNNNNNNNHRWASTMQSYGTTSAYAASTRRSMTWQWDALSAPCLCAEMKTWLTCGTISAIWA